MISGLATSIRCGKTYAGRCFKLQQSYHMPFYQVRKLCQLGSWVRAGLRPGRQYDRRRACGKMRLHDNHAASYPYKQVPLHTPDSVRLLELLPGEWNDPIMLSLKVGNSRTDAFETLSYCWDDPYAQILLETVGFPKNSSPDAVRNPIVSVVHCDGHPIDVKPNLFMALRRLRKPSEYRTLWIDAICLNQADNDEKSERVPLMGSIYGNAQKTIIWLGEEDKWTSASYETIKRWAAIYRNSKDIYQPDLLLALNETQGRTYKEEQLCFEALIRRAWFTRAWTFQEAVLSRQVDLRCGASSIPWGSFSDACAAVIGAGQDRYVFEENSNIQTLHDFTNLWAEMPSVKSRSLDERFRLSRLLQRTRLQQASDPRDKLFSLLGIANPAMVDQDSYKPDYNQSVKEVFCQFTKAMIKEDGDLGVLSVIQRPGLQHEQLSQEYIDALKILPSWVPAFNFQDKVEYIAQDTNILQNTPIEARRTYLPQPIAQQYTEGWPRYWLNRDKSYNVQSGNVYFETPSADSLGVYGIPVGSVKISFPTIIAGDPAVRVSMPTTDEVITRFRKSIEEADPETSPSVIDKFSKLIGALYEKPRDLGNFDMPDVGSDSINDFKPFNPFKKLAWQALNKYFKQRLDGFISIINAIGVQGNWYRPTHEPLQIALVKTLTADMLPISPRLPEYYKHTYFPFHYHWHFWKAGVNVSYRHLTTLQYWDFRRVARLSISGIQIWMRQAFRQRSSTKSRHSFDPNELKKPVRIQRLYERLLTRTDDIDVKGLWPDGSSIFIGATFLLCTDVYLLCFLQQPEWLWYSECLLMSIFFRFVYISAYGARNTWLRTSERDPSVPAELNWLLKNVPLIKHHELWGIACELQGAIDRASWNREFFITENGYIGIGPVGMKPGDEVFALLGGHVPHVLRRVSSGTSTKDDRDAKLPSYQFLGESYVHGIMDGELWPDPKVCNDLDKMKARCMRILLV